MVKRCAGATCFTVCIKTVAGFAILGDSENILKIEKTLNNAAKYDD